MDVDIAIVYSLSCVITRPFFLSRFEIEILRDYNGLCSDPQQTRCRWSHALARPEPADASALGSGVPSFVVVPRCILATARALTRRGCLGRKREGLAGLKIKQSTA